MLTTTRTKPPKTTLYSYIHCPDVNNHKWFSRNRGEHECILCDKEIKLTEELRTYLLYFGNVGNTIAMNLNAFTSLPIKEELC